jgi:tetratricopeptide (TPR) repeat protein
MTQHERRNYDAAIADFDEVIKRDAYHADAYGARGLAQHWKGNYAAAIADYDRALEIVPPNVFAYGVRGRAKFSLGKVDEALADYDEAIKAEPKKARHYLDRGEALASQGKMEDAEASFREALRVAPEDPHALNLVGYFLVRRDKNLAEALDLIRRAAAARPKDPSILHALGRAHFKLGHLDEAERHLTDSARRGNDSPFLHEHLGDTYARQGKTQKARDAWKKALSRADDAEFRARLEGKLSGAEKD